MNTGHPTRVRAVRVAKAVTLVDRRPDGTVYLRNPESAGPVPGGPDRSPGGLGPDKRPTAPSPRNGMPVASWQHLTYAGALERVRRVAQALLGRGLSAERPIVMLSGNSIDHLVLALAAMHVGIPYAPIAPAYSLLAREFDALRYVFDLMQPGLVFAADTTAFERALARRGPRGRRGRRRALGRRRGPSGHTVREPARHRRDGRRRAGTRHRDRRHRGRRSSSPPGRRGGPRQ